MRKPASCIYENKDGDQLRGSHEADQRLYFRYKASTIPLIRNSKPLAIFCGCTARFVLDLVRYPEDRFSHNEAQISHSVDNRDCHSVRFLSKLNVAWWLSGSQIRDVKDHRRGTICDIHAENVSEITNSFLKHFI